MRLAYILLCALILSCSNGQIGKDKSFCKDCLTDDSGQYKAETLNRFIRNKLGKLFEVDSIFKSNFLKCSKTEILSEFKWFYLSKDKNRNYYHLIGQGDYSTELWVVAVNKRDGIEYCFLGAASGGDGGDGYEIYSNLNDSILSQTQIYTSIFMDSLKNDFTDSLRTDSIVLEYLVRDNDLVVMRTDSLSKISKWENN